MKKEKDCIFCRIVKGEIPPGKGKIKESDNFLAFLDLNPHAEGHTLIIPKKHFVTILDIPNTLAPELLKIIKDVASELMDKKLGDGFNVIQNNLEVAGQVVMHAHFHIIPRKDNDGLRFLVREN
ncbi:MAG: HIT domain-containing protein [Nanoarchaeota archaeon]|nr:HIT domain-containing protein [Nanoarchaeota archaeon]MBU0978083.1 HIT domain-containing protein [Nanoarchaeota archaeon]